MFTIFNRSNKVINVCGVSLAKGETSEPIMDSYYDMERQRVNKLISLGLISKTNIEGVDDNEVRQRKQEEFQRKMEEQEAENRRIMEEQERMVKEMQKAEEEAKAQAQAQAKADEEAKKEEKKTVKKKTDSKKDEVKEESKEEVETENK